MCDFLSPTTECLFAEMAMLNRGDKVIRVVFSCGGVVLVMM